MSVPLAGERGLELRELLERAIATDVVVLLQATERHDQIFIEALIPRGAGFAMTFQSQLILIGARDLPGLRHLFAMLSHRHAGARLAHARQLRLEEAGTRTRPRRESLAERSTARTTQKQFAIRRGIDDGNIAGRIDARGDGGVDLTHRDFQTEHDGGIETGAAGALQIERRSFRRETAIEHALARQVEILGVLEHRAGADIAEHLAAQVECDPPAPSARR